MADIARQRSGLTPAGHPRVDECGIARLARLRTDTEPFADPGPEALQEHVGPLAQPEHDLGATRVLQVDADAAPAAVDHRECRRGPARHGSSRRDVRGAVDAEHLRAEVGQQHPGELHRTDVRELDDADARERSHHTFSRRAAFSYRNFGHT